MIGGVRNTLGSGWGLIQEWLGCDSGVIGGVLWEFVIIKTDISY